MERGPGLMVAGRVAWRGRLWAVLVALSLIAVVTSVHTTAGYFTDTSTVPGSTVTTSDCFQSRNGSVQTGTATSTANGTLSVPISSVDPARSFLLFNIRHLSNRPVGSTVRGRIASSTAVEFARVTNETTPVTITIRWYVVEYACGVRVQRGEVSQSATTIDVPISPVQSRSQAFVTWSKTPAAADSAWDQNDQVLAELTAIDNVQFRTNTAASSHTIWWQVIEFTNVADVAVQRGLTSMTGTSLSTTVTLPNAVDPARTFVLVDFRTSGAGPDIGARMLRARLTDPNTIVIDRSVSGTPDDIDEIAWQAIELKDGSRVQHGSEFFPAPDTQRTVSIQPIDTTRAAAFASVQYGGGQSGGRTPYVADDHVCPASYTASLTSSALTLQRACNAAGEDVGWFVVEWGGPTWWDNSWGFRQVIEVSAGTGAPPSGYSVSLTIDHAALVSAGKAKANGDDIRVLSWNGSAWVELDRVLDEASGWNGSATTIWFKTQSAIAAGASDRNYFLYYANPAATNPPASKANVFLLSEGFESGTLSGWTAHPPSDWYDSAWGYRKRITIDRTKVAATQANFPVLISITDAGLRDGAQPDADDILFTSSNGTTKLDHEVERYTASTGELVAWVGVPTLASTADTVLYMYYGNSSAAAQQNSAAVWDSGFAGAYHAKEIPTGTAGDVKDSTANTRHGTSTGGMGSGNQVAGQVGGSLDFDGINDKVSLGDMSTNLWSQVTAEAWIRPDSLGIDRVICKSTGLTTSTQFFCLGTNGSALRILMGTDGLGGADSGALDVSNQITTGAWQHIAFTWSGSTNQVLAYVNGTQVGSFALGGDTIKDSVQPVYIANANATDDRHFDGSIDEARVSSTVRSSSWIQTEYNNQSSPSTFFSVGAEQPAHAFSVVSDRARSGTYALKARPHSGIREWITRNGLNEADISMDAYWYVSSVAATDFTQGVRAVAPRPVSQYETTLQYSTGWNVGKTINDAYTEITPQPAGQNPQSTVWTRITTSIVGTGMKVLRDGSQIAPASGWTDVGTQLASGSIGFRGWDIGSGQAVWIDDIIVRKLVDSEPATSLGSEDRK
jgi:hypothetical protein